MSRARHFPWVLRGVPWEHWSGLLNLHLMPYKSEATGQSCLLVWLVAHVTKSLPVGWDSGRSSSPKRESQKEVLRCPVTSLRMRQTPRRLRDGKNTGLCWLKALIQLTLKLTLQQDSHLCGDHKFPYCVSGLSWSFYYLQLEASSLMNYS